MTSNLYRDFCLIGKVLCPKETLSKNLDLIIFLSMNKKVYILLIKKMKYSKIKKLY